MTSTVKPGHTQLSLEGVRRMICRNIGIARLRGKQVSSVISGIPVCVNANSSPDEMLNAYKEALKTNDNLAVGPDGVLLER